MGRYGRAPDPIAEPGQSVAAIADDAASQKVPDRHCEECEMRARRLISVGLLYAMVVTGCTPTVAVKAPTEPITVNLNIKIEHEIRVKVDRDLDTLFEGKDGIF